MRVSYGGGPASHTGPNHAPVSAEAGAKRWPMGTCRPDMGLPNRPETRVPTRAGMVEGTALGERRG